MLDYILTIWEKCQVVAKSNVFKLQLHRLLINELIVCIDNLAQIAICSQNTFLLKHSEEPVAAQIKSDTLESNQVSREIWLNLISEITLWLAKRELGISSFIIDPSHERSFLFFLVKLHFIQSEFILVFLFVHKLIPWEELIIVLWRVSHCFIIFRLFFLGVILDCDSFDFISLDGKDLHCKREGTASSWNWNYFDVALELLADLPANRKTNSIASRVQLLIYSVVWSIERFEDTFRLSQCHANSLIFYSNFTHQVTLLSVLA